jgi:hypothetical protein
MRSGRRAPRYRLIHELGVADPLVHQVHVGPQGEARIGMAEPVGDLPDVATLLEQQARAGVAEGVERHPCEPNIRRGRLQDMAGDVLRV